MKIKAVTSVTELKSGLYIKAFVNYIGQYIVRVENVVGKPYKKNENGWGKNLWRVQTKCNSGKRYESFVGDLIGHNSDIAIATLLPYSSEMMIKLASIDKFQFLELINGKELSSEEVAELIHDWCYQQWRDEESDKYYEEEYTDYDKAYDKAYESYDKEATDFEA